MSNNRDDTVRVNNLIFGSAFIMFLLIFMGEIMKPNPSALISPPGRDLYAAQSLLPDCDAYLCENKWVYIIAIGLPVLVYIVPVWIKSENGFCSFLRRLSNIILFVFTAAYAFVWVAHTGGLTGLYGAAYLSLFSVALVVPQRRSVKAAIAIPVAIGALLLALISPNKPEWYFCFLSIVGSFLGLLIATHLKQNEKV
jgi:hypothetical protein